MNNNRSSPPFSEIAEEVLQKDSSAWTTAIKEVLQAACTFYSSDQGRNPPKNRKKECMTLRKYILLHLNCMDRTPDNRHIRTVLLISAAILKPIVVNWDFEKYASKATRTRVHTDSRTSPVDIALKTKHGSPNLGVIDSACVIFDNMGRIMLWYLPGLIDDDHHVSICHHVISAIPIHSCRTITRRHAP